jgi:hypothetical protein
MSSSISPSLRHLDAAHGAPRHLDAARSPTAESLCMRVQARVPSKFARYFEPEEQVALFRSETRWNKEEDAAIIGRKSIPQIKLTRAQSAHRRELIGRLGGGTQSEKVKSSLAAVPRAGRLQLVLQRRVLTAAAWWIMQDEVTNYQLARAPPQFSLDAGDTRSVKKPGQSVVKEYIRVSQARTRELTVSNSIRHFP